MAVVVDGGWGFELLTRLQHRKLQEMAKRKKGNGDIRSSPSLIGGSSDGINVFFASITVTKQAM
jgi:hypothetical protein